MNLSKKTLLKIAVLLISVTTALALTFTATYSRYITTVDKDIGFKAKNQPKILLNDTEIEPNTLISITDWVEGVEQLNGSFSLTASGLQQDESINFYIRAFAEKQETTTQPSTETSDQPEATSDTESAEDTLLVVEDESQGEKLPIEMTLSLGDMVYPALESEINQESDCYIKNQKQGTCYFFYDSTETDPQPKEHIFTFSVEENNSLDFILNAYNADKKSDKIYIYIETFK